MEPVLIYTDSNFVDVGAIKTFSLDMAFGSDEQDFEAAFPSPVLSGGELLYIDGTEYGGIVDAVVQSTESDNVIYKGRTWHGMLAGKIVQPESGQDYYTLSGDANECISELLEHVDLDGILTARSSTAGISVNYQFDRFCNAYDGILRMLGSADAILRIERHDGITELWAESRQTIEDEADSDLMEFSITDSVNVPNHLVCAGEGELKDRIVVDLYADSDGNVSRTQTLFGADEIAVFYNYNNADEAQLIDDGTKELASYQQGGGADLEVNSLGDWHIGDRIQVKNNKTGVTIVSTIAKKIVKVEDGVLSVDYEVGDASAQSYGGGASAETNLVTPPANGGTGVTYGFEWQLIASSTGGSTLTFATSIYSEVMVLAKTSGYLGSIVLPVSTLSSTEQEAYLSGGATDGGGRAFVCNVSSTSARPIAAVKDGVDVISSTTWQVYGR